jgi:alpha-glucosidase
MTWLDAPAGVLAFRRPGGFVCVVNLREAPVDLPAGEVLLASGYLEDGRVPSDTAVWLRSPDSDG